VQRCLPAAYPAKAALPFGSSNNELHSCRLSIEEKREANNRQEQSNAPLTVRYEIYTSHYQPRIEQLICRTNHVAQQFSCFSLDYGTERWKKRSWITSGGHTSIGIDWHPFGVLEADDYCQKQPFAIWQQIDICELYRHELKVF
jgi:hypothetical protein